MDDTLAKMQESAVLTYISDHLGSPYQLTDATGSTKNVYRYLAFGTSFQLMGSSPNRIGYTGREADPEFGLLFLRNRWYHPEMGRLLSRDPIGFAGGINVYGYVGNNPIRYRDPRGLEVWSEDFWPGGPGRPATEAEKDRAFYQAAAVVVAFVTRPSASEWALWVRNPFAYEWGSLTMPDRVHNAIAGLNALEKGAHLWRIYGLFGTPWQAILAAVEAVRFPGQTWAKTIPTGPTPAGWLGTIALWVYREELMDRILGRRRPPCGGQ
ncbi:MAG: RHS repeat-associated core domain-containing protein [Candidatus Riflebacteria bacterium]|nr:RHS repeat-associated core domain-containing protein [Candidatus Riflebacteria bacterium]